jgi:hypothetical protein
MEYAGRVNTPTHTAACTMAHCSAKCTVSSDTAARTVNHCSAACPLTSVPLCPVQSAAKAGPTAYWPHLS